MTTPESPQIGSPWLSAASYWAPQHYVESAWIEHAPFAFWLMDVLRPRAVAELGTHRGYSLFVFAEAAKRLGLETSFVGVDSWEGDDQAGFYGQDVLDTVRSVVDADYPELVQLRQGYFSAVASSFALGSLDLLHIDGRHGYEDVAEDFGLYLPMMSERGVVIMHDTFEFQPGFGVNRFWNEVSTRYPSFNFQHGHGLGVLAVGHEVPEALLDFLVRASTDPQGARDAYSRLGAQLSATASLKTLVEERMEAIEAGYRIARDQNRRIEELTDENARLADQVAALIGAIAQICRSTSWRITAPIRAISSAVHGLHGR